MGMAWAYRGHGMGIAGTWLCNPKAKRDTVPGIQKPGVQRGVANAPLAKSANALWDISLYFALQPSRRDNLQGKETSLSERGNLPGKQALRIKMIHKKIA